MRMLKTHLTLQCPTLNPKPGIIVDVVVRLFHTLRVFSPGSQATLLPQKPTFLDSTPTCKTNDLAWIANQQPSQQTQVYFWPNLTCFTYPIYVTMKMPLHFLRSSYFKECSAVFYSFSLFCKFTAQ